MIYVISNVDYPESRKLCPAPDDLLVFLNKAKSAGFYRDHAKKMCIRRSPKPDYGADLEGADNWFIFSGPPEKTIPGKIIAEIKKTYDFDYEIEPGKARCPTTGYMAVKWLEKTYPGEEIVLVNFGFGVRNSSYRCPWHNWRFEDKELARFRHVYTNPPVAVPDAPQRRKRVFYKLSGWLGDQVYASAVVTNIVAAGFAVNVNPEAHRPLWNDCPLLDRSIDEDNADVVIRERYPYPWTIGAPHIIDGVTAAAAYDLSADIPVLVERPHIWMDLPKARLIADPYVVILTGWQNSAPTKKWSQDSWQQVVSTCRDVKFVQVGQRKNHSTPLDGVVDMIDKTPLRDLVRLIRDAECVISPPSGVIHVAAAFRVPAIMLAGGREAPTVAAYPGGKVLSRCGGELSCCREGGCHRNHFGHDEKQCRFFHGEDDGEPTADCMMAISPDEVAASLREILTTAPQMSGG